MISLMESEMIFILLLALIVLGPRRLPEIGRQIGRALAEFRRAKNEFVGQIEEEVRRLELEEKLQQPSQPASANQILPPGSPPNGTVTSAISSDSGSAIAAAPGSHA
jgi:sec-independent protein translocase protein TatB